jgi:hypothetical protein
VAPSARHSQVTGNLVLGGLFILAVTFIPVCIGVAVLRTHLWDIGLVISRTLTYALVTALLVGVYSGLVLLATRVLPFHTAVAVAVSTLVVAALFNPLRRRLQHAVDRRFNRARYNADQAVAAFRRPAAGRSRPRYRPRPPARRRTPDAGTRPRVDLGQAAVNDWHQREAMPLTPRCR